jgi:xanthine dehydrogenase large subunit
VSSPTNQFAEYFDCYFCVLCRVKGHVSATGQSHFYMEAQTALSTPVDGDCVDVVTGTQDPAGNLSYIAGVLGLPQNKVTVTCPRVGGAFGGKITRAITVSAASALAAKILKRPVRIFNTRTADMAMTGGRESFAVDYEIGFSADGVITSVIADYYIDGGIASGDAFGGLYMGMHWADNAYYLPNYLANAKLCYTNTPARTSMRAPGVVQACLATETLVERVAVELGLPVNVVQERNFIRDGATTITGQQITNCTISRVWDTLMKRSLFQGMIFCFLLCPRSKSFVIILLYQNACLVRTTITRRICGVSEALQSAR